MRQRLKSITRVMAKLNKVFLALWGQSTGGEQLGRLRENSMQNKANKFDLDDFLFFLVYHIIKLCVIS